MYIPINKVALVESEVRKMEMTPALVRETFHTPLLISGLMKYIFNF